MTSPFKHQQYSLDFCEPRDIVFDMSEPGTGKTPVHLWNFQRQHRASRKAGIVLATKSLLDSAWAHDAAIFTPELRVSIAWAEHRQKAFETEADLYIVNHDGAKWLSEQPPSFLKRFGHGIVDESTAFKHANSQRSKALKKIRRYWDTAAFLSGQCMPNGVLDVWNQACLLDGGKRLGSSYYQFRNTVCNPEQDGEDARSIKWVGKPGAEIAIAARLADISILHRLDECVDMPEKIVRAVAFNLAPKHQAIYEEMQRRKLAEVNDTVITAFNGAVLWTKLLQIASGSVYGPESAECIDDRRYELVVDLAEEAPFSVVLFQWQHQRNKLEELAKARGITFATIDGETSRSERARIVEAYQAGFYRILFGHPQSMGHGLTLTRGVRTIWASPTINLEWWEQANRRIFRIGQTRRTETIVVVAENTKDQDAYDGCMAKREVSGSFLDQIHQSTYAKAA